MSDDQDWDKKAYENHEKIITPKAIEFQHRYDMLSGIRDICPVNNHSVCEKAKLHKLNWRVNTKSNTLLQWKTDVKGQPVEWGSPVPLSDIDENVS